MTREKIKNKFLKFFEKIDIDKQNLEDFPEAFLIDGEWYFPIFGCDTIEHILDEFHR